jgi:hypothetical protein
MKMAKTIEISMKRNENESESIENEMAKYHERKCGIKSK